MGVDSCAFCNYAGCRRGDRMQHPVTRSSAADGGVGCCHGVRTILSYYIVVAGKTNDIRVQYASRPSVFRKVFDLE